MRTSNRLLLVSTSIAALAFAAAACGGGGSAPTISSFAATPEALPSTGGSVLLTWNVVGARSIDIEPGVGLVTGTSASVNVTTNSTFTLTAENSHGQSSADTSVTVGAPVHVSGTISSTSIGRLQGATVLVVGQPDVLPATTNSAGQFELDGVVQPYDLAIETVAGPLVFMVRGILRQDPYITFPQVPSFPVPPQTSRSGAVTGTALGVTFPLPGTQALGVFGQYDDVVQSISPASNGDLLFSASWTNRDTIAAKMNGFLIDTSTPSAPTYKFGSQQLTLNKNTTSGPVNLTLSSIPTITASGTIEFPPDFSGAPAPIIPFVSPLLTRTLAPFPTFPDIALPVAAGTNGSFSFAIPALPEGQAYAFTQGSTPNGFLAYDLALGAGTKSVRLPEVPTFQLPIANATIGFDSKFAMSLEPGLVAVHQFQIGGVLLFVMTTEPQFTLNDLGVEELGLFPATSGNPFSGNWQAFAYGMFPSIDDALDPALTPHDRAFVAVNGARSFVVQP